MKIDVVRLGNNAAYPISFEDWADQNSFSVRVREMSRNNFYAELVPFTEEMKNGMLQGCYGYGSTPESAVLALAEYLPGRRLAVHAYGAYRREIKVPTEWATK